jgi:hypothetical protein
MYLIDSNISGGNSDAGFPAATSVIHVAYTMYEVRSYLFPESVLTLDFEGVAEEFLI